MLSTGGPIPEGCPCGGKFCPAGRWPLLIVPAWEVRDDYGCRAVRVRRTRISPVSPEGMMIGSVATMLRERRTEVSEGGGLRRSDDGKSSFVPRPSKARAARKSEERRTAVTK